MAVRTWLRGGVLALAAAGLVLAALEAGLRLAGKAPRVLRVNPYLAGRSWAAPDARLGWRNREGTFTAIEGPRSPMRFLADGRRFDPAARGRKEGAEILLVGGSFAQGYGVRDGETFAALLNARFPALHVLNYGTGGYSTLQALRMAERQLAAPQRKGRVRALVYAMIAHHAARNVAAVDWVRYLTTSDGRLLAPPHMRLKGGRLVPHAGGPVPVWPLETRSALVRLAHDGLLALVHDASEAESMRVTIALVQRMQALARRHGALFLTMGLTALPEPLRAGLREAAIPFLDCNVPGWWRRPEMRVGGRGHPSARLHRAYADCLGAWIARQPALRRPREDEPAGGAQ